MMIWASDNRITRVRLPVAEGPACLEFVTQDPRVLDVLNLVRQVADTDATVLITGESGTGKEFIARSLHEESRRRDSLFLAVNCGAIAESLEDSELFGHVRGAFTGATEHRMGKFEAADGGTLFLDEVSEMGATLQTKLLRILQYGDYCRVGEALSRRCNVRVVAATNQDLQSLIETGTFRPDLYYRLNIIRLDLPPLRQRRDDIPLLIDHFVRVYAALYGKEGLIVSPEFRDTLLAYDFPGNVRELESIIQRAVILSRPGPLICPLQASHNPLRQRSAAPPYPANFHEAKSLAMEEFERNYLCDVLSACGGIVCRAAELSGLSERNWHEKLKRYGIRSQAFRGCPKQGGRIWPEDASSAGG